MTAGSEMEMARVMGKLKETVDLEAETMAGTESGADTDAGMDSESTADRSRAVAGPEASARCAIVTGGGDAGADLRSTVAGTATGDDAVAVANGRVSPIAETILLACVARDRRSGNGAGGVIRGVYRFGMNSIYVCGGKQGLSAGKCAVWNCRNGNGAGGGGGVFVGGCTFGHESGNAYGGRGSKCKYGNIVSFGGAVIGMEN